MKMSSGIVLSPNHGINKTRNAILRMKKCSPELRAVLRQRCQERIQNDRQKILHQFRKVKIQDSFKIAFGNILKEEWKNINYESNKENYSPEEVSSSEFNLDEELILEELLEKDLLLEQENWILELYEEFLNEYVEDSDRVVCPLCCSGFLKQTECHNFNRTLCTKCSATFQSEKDLYQLQAAIFDSIAWHDKECSYNSSFVSIPINEKENNLCIVCHYCSYLYVIE